MLVGIFLLYVISSVYIFFLFQGCSSSPLPSHIFICLTPKTEADRHFVEQRGQNPLIRIRVAIGDQLSRIFYFLKIKWNLRMQKLVSFNFKLLNNSNVLEGVINV